jgi:hypothetical protein
LRFRKEKVSTQDLIIIQLGDISIMNSTVIMSSSTLFVSFNELAVLSMRGGELKFVAGVVSLFVFFSRGSPEDSTLFA